MSIKIKNLRIVPYSQKDDLKIIFGDQMTVTFEIAHVAGESYACALDNERILYPPNRPVCAYTEAFTRDGDNITFTLDLRTSKLRDFVSSIRKPMPIWLQVVRGVNGKYETVVLDDVLALPSVIDGSMTVYDGDPIKSLIDAKMDTPQAEGTEGQVLTMDADGHYAWADLPEIPEQEQADWTETDDTKKSFILHKPELANVATSGSYNDLTDTPDLATVATSGSYNDLTDTPDLAAVATSGDYADLSNTPNLAAVATTGDYSDLSGTPQLAAVATSGDYSDLNNTPNLATVATTGDYGDLTGTPPFANVAISGDYNDLSNTPDLTVFVEKENGKGLSTNDFTDAEQTKLEGIEAGAQVNVKPNWLADESDSDGILNKPVIPAAQIQSDWEQSDSLAVDFIKGKPFIDDTPYLAFKIVSIDENESYPAFGLFAYGSPNAVTLETSTDKKTWTSHTLSYNTIYNMASGLTVGDTIYLRGDNATFSKNYDAYWYFAANGMELEASGDCMSLLSKDFSVKEIPEYGFNSLFEYGYGGINNWLLSVPDVNAEAVNYRSCRQMFKNCKKIRKPMAVLPAMQFKGNDVYRNMFNSSGLDTAPMLPCMNLTAHCYGGMFQNSALVVAPELPATEMPHVDGDPSSNYSPYDYMFSGAENLVKAPSVLPALTLYAYTYQRMFYGCRSLEKAPQILATTMGLVSCTDTFRDCTSLTYVPNLAVTAFTGNHSCTNMFSGCTSLVTMPNLPATDLTGGNYCYNQMFWHCESLKNYINSTLPATTLSQGCYYQMFGHCYSLEKAPYISATTTTSECFYGMFSNCRSLTTPPSALNATIVAPSAYQYMFERCEKLKTPPTMSNATEVQQQGCASMFQYCTSLETAPVLNATTLGEQAYGGMFGDCKSLKKMPSLPATTLATQCYQWMFASSGVEYCENLPATTLASNCYQSMFENCKSLTATGNIRATTLAYNSMRDMFKNCNNLRRIKVAFETWNTDNTYWWVSGVGNYGAFVCPSTLAQTYGVSNVPSGWTIATVGVDAGQTKNSWYLSNIADYVIQPEASEVDRLIVNDGATTVIKASMGGMKNGTTQVGYAEVIIDLWSGGTVTEGANIEFVDAFEAGYRHICVVRWYNYENARLYIVDKIALS